MAQNRVFSLSIWTVPFCRPGSTSTVNQQDPKKITRTLEYYRYLNDARLSKIDQFKDTINSLAQVVIDQQEQAENTTITNGVQPNISQIHQDSIQIYPNPAADQFFINLDRSNFYNVEIIDILGRSLIRKEHVNNLTAINTTKLSEGTYFVHIQTYIDSQIYKIVIDR